MPQMLTPGDGQDLFARIKRAWEERDPDAILELFSEEAEYRPDPFEPPFEGANAIRAHWNGIVAAQDHVEFDVEHVWVVGRTVLGNWHVAVTQRDTAERRRVRGFTTMEVDAEGLVVRMREWRVARTVGIDSSYKPQG